MKNRSILLLVPLLALAAPACSGGGGGTGGNGGGGGAGGSGVCSGTTLMASAAHDYAFASTLTFPPVKVKPMTDLTFDWGGVTTDFLGHDLDPKKDLNTILVLMWKLTLSDLQTKLNADSLQQRDLVTLPLQYTTDGNATSANLLAFTNSGNPDATTILSFLDATQYPPASYTYTLMAATGSTLGEGTKMIQSFQVDPNSTNTSVTMTTDSTQLTYTADLHSLTPTEIPAGQAGITLDWSQMTKNALGNDFVLSNITRALVGQYTQTPTELETQFLDLELIPTKLYEGDIVTGTTVNFSSLKTDNSEPFQGIDDTGTWLVALQCGGCRNPAPWYLTILKPCQ